MPRRVQAPRLWLRNARSRSGKLTHHATWFIKDGRHHRSTGCRADDRDGAERALADYLSQKHVKGIKTGVRAPASIPIADVIALYAKEKALKTARPKETAARLEELLNFFGTKTLADINGEICREYARMRNRAGASRRELEDLRAAIIHHRREGLCSAIVEIVLPPKGEARERWLTRDEAATLIRRAWRFREVQKGHATGRASRRHVARFIIAGLYTTRRKSAILSAALKPAEDRPWIDLKRGIFYGRPAAKRSKKRQPTIVVPPRLLAHLRRWHRNGQEHIVEFNERPVGSIDKAFAANANEAGFEADVVPHTLRHSGITWLAIEGVDPYEICRFAGITMEVFEQVYAHHHPAFMRGVHQGFSRHRYRHRNTATDQERTSSKVTKIADF